MYVGLFCHSAVAFNVFKCFFVFLCFTDCLCSAVVVFFFSDIIDIFSCRPIATLINDSCYYYRAVNFMNDFVA